MLRHKWLESERAGRDIGFERALMDWVLNHRTKWRKSRQASRGVTRRHVSFKAIPRGRQGTCEKLTRQSLYEANPRARRRFVFLCPHPFLPWLTKNCSSTPTRSSAASRAPRTRSPRPTPTASSVGLIGIQRGGVHLAKSLGRAAHRYLGARRTGRRARRQHAPRRHRPTRHRQRAADGGAVRCRGQNRLC